MAERTTIGELSDKINAQAYNPLYALKPSTGGSTEVGAIYNPKTGNTIGTSGESITYRSPDVTDASARIGDYVLQGGTPVLVPNSPTEIVQRYANVTGGSEKPVSISMPTVAAGIVQGGTLGSVAGSLGGPVGKAVLGAIGGLVGGLNAVVDAQKEALEAWKKQEVVYENPVTFSRDPNGKLVANLDYSKMATGGVLSGSGVKEAQNKETTVELGNDGRLKIGVSPVFAGTNLYKSLVDQISSAYAGLTKDTPDFDRYITEIKQLIDSNRDQYNFEMQSYADYKTRFDAKPESIVSAYSTELAGYIDPEKMGDYTMVVISGDGTKEQSAKDFFDSVLNMNKDERNSLLKTLYEIIGGEDEDGNQYSEDQKAIAYGELRALQAASSNVNNYKDDKYQGMLDADIAVTFMNTFSPLGLNAGDVVKFITGGNLMGGKQEYLNHDEMAQTVGIVGGVAAGLGTIKGLLGSGGKQGMIGNMLKKAPGTGALFKASLEGQEGGAIAFFAAHAGETKAVAKAVGASMGFNVAKTAIFDAALAGSKTVVSGEDFAKNFGEDFARDIIIDLVFQYYDAIKFEKNTVDSVVYVTRDVDGNVKIIGDKAEIDTAAGEEFIGAFSAQKTRAGEQVAIVASQYGTTYYYNGKTVTVSPSGEIVPALSAGDTPNLPVLRTGVVTENSPEVTTNDIKSALAKSGVSTSAEVWEAPESLAKSAETAGKIAKVESTKAGLAVNKALFNKNAALDTVNDMAYAKDMDKTAWQQRSNTFANDMDAARSLKTDIDNGKFLKSIVNTKADRLMKFGTFTEQFGAYKPKVDGYYLNARRALEMAQLAESEKTEGDTRDYIKEALEKYGKYLTDIPQDRAMALDEFQNARKAYLADFVKSVKKSGMLDNNLLDNVTESSVQTKIGYVPLWGKKETYNGLLSRFYGISQERHPIKSWIREGELVDIDKFEDPLEADNRITQFFAQNMALNQKVQLTAEALDSAGLLVDNTPSPTTVREKKLKSIKNKTVLTKKMDNIIAEKKKWVDANIPSEGEYAKNFTDIYNKNKIDQKISQVISKYSDQKVVNLVNAVDRSVREAAKYNEIFGREFDVDSFMNTDVLPNISDAINAKDASLVSAVVHQAMLDAAPYTSRSSVLKRKLDEAAEEWREWAEKNIKAGRVSSKDKKELVDLVAAEMNGDTIDAQKMGASATAIGLGGRYPVTWYQDGKPYTRFIKYTNEHEKMLAEAITKLFTDKQLLKQPGLFSRYARGIANNFRLATTGWDPSRVMPNLARDTGRGEITSAGNSFADANKILSDTITAGVELGLYSEKQGETLRQAIDNAAKKVAGETYNQAYGSPRKAATQLTKEYLSETGASPLRVFTYNLIHDKKAILEWPGDFFEGFTRKRLAKSEAAVALRKAQKEGKSFDEILKTVESAATFAGKEYTANFSRKGELINLLGAYVPYLSSSFAGIDGFKRAYINNPSGVAKNFATFLLVYMILLADTLSDENSRKNYYRLSDYDRGNSIILALDNNTVLTIPLDQETASLLFPYRRIIETLNNVDPVSFFELIWGTVTEPIPFDLSGFSEGGGFNLFRGLERLGSQMAPTVGTAVYKVATGRDPYYGSNLRVTDEELQAYGIYDPSAGDYTRTSKDSATLRAVSDRTGIPQWQLQSIVSSFGGNIGQYALNTIDKLSGATGDRQGGKDFTDAVFKSFVATDSDNAANQFYAGIDELKGEKQTLLQKLYDLNQDMKTASGDSLYELQAQYQKAKDDFATKVGDFVNQYLNAYEITGGLSKSQAMQIYYLFRLDDDRTIYETGSVAEYYAGKTEQQMKNAADAMAAPVLDKYYDQTKRGLYQDSEGTWRIYAPYGQKAFLNTIYGEGTAHEVNLRNILEGKTSSLKSAKTAVNAKRAAAANAGNWDERNRLGAEFDNQVIDAIAPYINRYGAENVLGNSTVLDYLSDWFFVPDSFIKTKKGKYVSLANNASTQEAFVRPYIKYLFGLATNYNSYNEIKLKNQAVGDFNF